MKILVITNNLNHNSGWGRYSLAIINQYQNFNIDYKVIVAESDSKNFNLLCILKPNNNLINFIINIIRVRRLSRGFDIIHAFDGWPYSIFGYAAVLNRNCKLFINGVGTYSVEPFNNKIKKLLLGLAYKKARQIFCISKYTEGKILDKIKLDNTQVVHLGTPNFAILRGEVLEKLKMKFNIKDSYPIILTVGQIKERKGQYHAVEATNYLKRKYPNFRYYLIGSTGDGEYEKQIREFCAANGLEKNIFIEHDLKDEELVFFYQICDIFILPSINNGDFFEGFGLVLLEAGQFGVPLIGSKDCGIEEAIKNGYNGYLIEQGKPKDIYEKIEKILSVDRQQWSENSRAFTKFFNWSDTVKKYVEYYQKN